MNYSMTCSIDSFRFHLNVIAITMSLCALAVADEKATTEAGMKPYTEQIPSLKIKMDFVPIPSGTFAMGSPDNEDGRLDDESPRVRLRVEAFWMMKYEVTWREYKTFMEQYKKFPKQESFTPKWPGAVNIEGGTKLDAVSYPTPVYDESELLAKGSDPRLPAVCLTPFAARQFTKWLSMKTGRLYRLPTEAEWEYACRAGSASAWHFGDDADRLGDHAWYFDNSEDAKLGEEAPRPVGQKKPNKWGLYDMHGNVSELVMDQYVADRYRKLPSGKTVDAITALLRPKTEHPRVFRGGSFLDDPEDLRCARRFHTDEDLKKRDPQIPQSIWYFTEAHHIGFRVVRPIKPPTAEQRKQWWGPEAEEIVDVLEFQRTKDS